MRVLAGPAGEAPTLLKYSFVAEGDRCAVGDYEYYFEYIKEVTDGKCIVYFGSRAFTRRVVENLSDASLDTVGDNDLPKAMKFATIGRMALLTVTRSSTRRSASSQTRSGGSSCSRCTTLSFRRFGKPWD